jgi:hypothetical protein
VMYVTFCVAGAPLEGLRERSLGVSADEYPGLACTEGAPLTDAGGSHPSDGSDPLGNGINACQ